MEPSPTAEATLLTLPDRASPTANTAGKLDSSMCGRRFNGQGIGGSFVSISQPVRTNPLLSREVQPAMNLQLNGKKAIVTGGSAGIGLAIARLLAEEGVEVTIPGRNGKKLKEAIASLSGVIHGIETDLATAEGAKKLIEQVPATDILVNNLGIYESKSFTDISDEDWFRYFEINLLGGIRLARHYFPAMLKENSGRVIFVLSEAGAETHPDMIHYGVTKTGQVVVARGLAELTKGTKVTVNSILPGPTRSEANDEFIKGMASTPNATFEQAEKEFFAKHRSTSLLHHFYSGWRVKVKWPAWSLISPARWPLQPTERPCDAREAF